MGKKKSVVLMTLLTIVIVVLCAVTALPSFNIPYTVKSWNPTINQYDLGADLGGGYYVYCYPEGVISETEYKNNLAVLEGTEKENYIAEYKPHNGGNLYLHEDREWADDDFEKAKTEIIDRFKAKNYSDYRISVVDDYALKIDIPKSETATQNGDVSVIGQTISLFTLMGDFTIQQGGVTVDELKDYEPSKVIKSVSVDTEYEVAYVEVKFTNVGETMLEDYIAEQEAAAESSDSSSAETSTTLDFMIGDQMLLSVSTDYIDQSNMTVRYPVAYESNIRYVETMVITLNSAIEKGGYDIEFSPISTSDIRTYGVVYGDQTLDLLYIAIGIAILLFLIFAIVKMGRFGVVSAYVSLSYFIITGICFAFISEGLFEFTLGTVLVFLAGLVLVNVLHMHTYYAIKKEFDLGKTVESSVKGGYTKTLFGILDIYAVLLLAGLAMLIGVAGLNTLALQILICVVAGAFCNLLWSRAINYTLLSASKNKYKYFRFVREDDEDDE